MLKFTAVFALAGIFALGVPGKPASTGGSWLVDARHSDAQLITDGTTDYGKNENQRCARRRQGERQSDVGRKISHKIQCRIQNLSGYFHVACHR